MGIVVRLQLAAMCQSRRLLGESGSFADGAQWRLVIVSGTTDASSGAYVLMGLDQPWRGARRAEALPPGRTPTLWRLIWGVHAGSLMRCRSKLAPHPGGTARRRAGAWQGCALGRRIRGRRAGGRLRLKRGRPLGARGAPRAGPGGA